MTLPEPDAPPRVVALHWELFLRWLESNWPPGCHFALIGPTGEGKTTFAIGILNLRRWVMALDAKGEDSTLASSGFKRVLNFPEPWFPPPFLEWLFGKKRRNLPSDILDDIAEGLPARLIIGGPTTSDEEERALRSLLADAVKMVRHQGGWTLYADEFQILSDLRMFGLGKPIEQGLVSARDKGTSIVTSFQAPAWVPKASTRQATLVAMWPTRDRAMIKSVAESMGRDFREVEEIIRNLPRYHTLVIPKSIFEPYIITHAPKIGA